MKFLREQDVVKCSDELEIEYSCILMHCGAQVVIQRLSHSNSIGTVTGDAKYRWNKNKWSK